MPTNLVGEERLTLLSQRGVGDVLTIPESTNGAVINVLSGKVRYTLDGTDPAACDGSIAYQGQSINLTRLPNMGSIIRTLRIRPLAEKTQIIAYYFD